MINKSGLNEWLAASDSYLDRMSPARLTVVGLALIALVGLLDHLSGFELSFSIFYLPPIVLGTWYGRRWTGLVLSLASAMVWLLVDFTSGHLSSHWMIPGWNAVVRLGFFLVTTYLLDELKTHLRREQALSRTDSLTKVLNPRAFRDISERLLQLAARHGHQTALGFIDIDNFKAVNDFGGHAEGDRALEMVAAALTRSVRGSDVVARLGGDEFVVLMPEITLHSARVAFARIHRELTLEAATGCWPIGFSIGVVLFHRVRFSGDEAVDMADRLMYRAKSAGKNTIVYEEVDGTQLD